MLCSLAKLNGVVARRGAVLIGRNAAVLCAGPTEVLMAHNARGPCSGERACLRGCWGGGDHVYKRRGRRVVCASEALWRALGMAVEKLGACSAGSPGAGCARG